MQQRTLAATALADDGQELAFANFHVDALQHREAELAFAVALEQIARGEQRVGGGRVGDR